MRPVTGALSAGIALAYLLGATAEPVIAQDRFDIENFHPAPDVSGSVLSVYGARTAAPGDLSVTLFGSYGHDPMVIENGATGEKLGDLVSSVGTAQLMAALGLSERLDLGLTIPLHRIGAGSDFSMASLPTVAAATVPATTFALGDGRIVPRMTVVKHAGDSGFDLGIAASLWVPTGNDQVYAGEPVRVEPRLALSYTAYKSLFALNAGYLLRKRAQVAGSRVDDIVPLGVGADIALGGGVSILAELNTQLNVLSKDFTTSDAPTEALGGLRFRGDGVLSQVGGGPGLVHGMGAPTFRVFASITIKGTPLKPTSDGDHDGIRDDDRCPTMPEDKDGFEDDDGCPDPDNDGDGIPDASDRCPNKDADGFENAESCRDDDHDGDGFLDGVDRCPNAAGAATELGCPEKAASLSAQPAPQVRVTASSIEFGEVVYFERTSAQLQERSFPLMDSVAKALNKHPEIELLIIEGHSDSVGTEEYNRELSTRRAELVRIALIRRGVAAERLLAVGVGQHQPVAPNDTAENRAKNRRVELRIARRAK